MEAEANALAERHSLGTSGETRGKTRGETRGKTKHRKLGVETKAKLVEAQAYVYPGEGCVADVPTQELLRDVVSQGWEVAKGQGALLAS